MGRGKGHVHNGSEVAGGQGQLGVVRVAHALGGARAADDVAAAQVVLHGSQLLCALQVRELLGNADSYNDDTQRRGW
jgi:hypothetical protein